MRVLDNLTDAEMEARAIQQSKGGYSAIVLITRYMQSESFLTIATGRTPFKHESRRGESCQVMRQWRDGKPLMAPRRPAYKPLVDIGNYTPPDGLPF